jgi:hypothetical protein
MLKNFALGVVILAAAFANAQKTEQPTKTAPADALTWSQGLPGMDAKWVNKIGHGLGEEDKYMVWTAIVRNREASRDIFKGENLTNDKVLANVRVRMSTEESNRWTTSWSHMNSWQRNALIRVLRDDLAIRH